MNITNDVIFQEANSILKSIYGDRAVFRDGQYEAIEAVATSKRTIVVQSVGWGNGPG